jgi:CubicO group peptidase (beta-lactamase class C family)
MEFGLFSVDDSYLIASASKWLTAMVIMNLVEQGVMNLDDRPQDYTPWWTSDPADARSRITLEQLLSFTAGFDTDPGEDSCVTVALTTVNLCAQEFYDGGVAYEPGTTFYYGPAHMQVAARMAELAAGLSYTDLVDQGLSTTLGLTQTSFRVPSATNPRASGGGRSSARDYSKVLQAILQGTFLSGVINEMEIDRTGPPVAIGNVPPALVENDVDFRYSLGHWRECTQSVWDASCDNLHISSSTGAFGWHPWIDYDNGYYGVLAVFETSINGGSPGSASVNFALEVQPLIVSALADLRAQR